MSRAHSRRVGMWLLGIIAAAAAAAPRVTAHDVARQFPDFVYAPPMPPRVIDADGRWHAPFVYPVRLVDRLHRRYEEDRSTRVPLRLFERGVLIAAEEGAAPWLPLGGDALGRDVFARLLRGARWSLGVAVLAALGALVLGAAAGATAGYAGGRVDDWLMRLADFVLVLPVTYVVLSLRASMPLVLSNAQVFWSVVAVLAAAGWPYAARGVRAVVAAEAGKEYAEAARSAGAGGVRILLRHLLPAAKGFLVVQAMLLLPAFILAEATLSFVGLGFAEPAPSWGVMLHDAAHLGVLSEAPWLLAPAAAIVVTLLAVHLASVPAQDDDHAIPT